MDQRVLEAQQWVNAIYGAVAGYQRCPEDGRTGWSTMYSLTMGLQHELGISPVVASFGADMRVFPIYQDNARQLSDFTHSHGYQHALNAHQLAVGYGFNRGTVI